MSRPAAVKSRRRSAFGESGIVAPHPAPGFTCEACGRFVPLDGGGTGHRNHCPHCLWSCHLDVHPGDRANLCRSPMEPVAIWVLTNGEQRIVHRCSRCGTLKANRVAGDDSEGALRELADRAAEGREVQSR